MKAGAEEAGAVKKVSVWMDTDILHTTFLYSFQNDILTLFTTGIYAGPVV